MPTRLVLLVDDDPDTTDLYEIVFQRLGHATLTAPDGETAVGLLRERRPDLMLLDLHLPGISGLEVLRSLRQTERDSQRLPVLVLTADAFSGDIDALRKLNCDGILTKPVDLA